MNPLHLFHITNIRIMQDITNGRCGWCGTDELYVKYHDQEWGKLVRLSGNFWLLSFKISYLCLPLFYETRTTPSCHPSGCAYRQL